MNDPILPSSSLLKDSSSWKFSPHMNKLKLTGQNLAWVFNFRSGHLHAATFWMVSVKLPNLQLKTRPKQLLGSLPLVIALPGPHINKITKLFQDGRLPLHYTSSSPKARQLHSVLINRGADPNAEDNFQHTAQYYVDHPDEVYFNIYFSNIDEMSFVEMYFFEMPFI